MIRLALARLLGDWRRSVTTALAVWGKMSVWKPLSGLRCSCSTCRSTS